MILNQLNCCIDTLHFLFGMTCTVGIQLIYCDLMLYTTPACFSIFFFGSTMFPTLV